MARPVVCTPDVCGGSPRISDTRLTCANVALMLKHLTLNEFLETYRDLSVADVQNSLEYCSQQKCLRDQPLHYCQRCTLDDRAHSQPGFVIENGELVANPKAGPDSDGHLFLGSLAESEEDAKPHDIWLIARELLSQRG